MTLLLLFAGAPTIPSWAATCHGRFIFGQRRPDLAEIYHNVLIESYCSSTGSSGWLQNAMKGGGRSHLELSTNLFPTRNSLWSLMTGASGLSSQTYLTQIHPGGTRSLCLELLGTKRSIMSDMLSPEEHFFDISEATKLKGDCRSCGFKAQRSSPIVRYCHI